MTLIPQASKGCNYKHTLPQSTTFYFLFIWMSCYRWKLGLWRMTDHQHFLLIQHESAVGDKLVPQVSQQAGWHSEVLHALLRRELKGHPHQNLRDSKVNNLKYILVKSLRNCRCYRYLWPQRWGKWCALPSLDLDYGMHKYCEKVDVSCHHHSATILKGRCLCKGNVSITKTMTLSTFRTTASN